jgi:hypothetical protein
LVAPSVGVASAELPLEVEAPALDDAVVEQRARMGTPGGDRGGGAFRTEVDRLQAVAHLAVVVAPVRRVALAELTEEVVPPALDVAVVPQRTCVEIAGGDRNGSAPPSPVIRRRPLPTPRATSA